MNSNPGAACRSLPYFLYRGVTWLKVLKAELSQLTFVVALMDKWITGHAGNSKQGNDVNREYFEKHRKECLRPQGTRLTAGGIFHISNIKEYHPYVNKIWGYIYYLLSWAWDELHPITVCGAGLRIYVQLVELLYMMIFCFINKYVHHIYINMYSLRPSILQLVNIYPIC